MNLNPRDILLNLSTSRHSLELGEGWEILLEISNLSDTPIWITGVTTTLTIPAEVIHPQEQAVASRGAQLPTTPGGGFDSVRIQPNGRYICFWRVFENVKEMDKATPLIDLVTWHIFFHPGTYEIQANLHIWTDKPDMRKLLAPRIDVGDNVDELFALKELQTEAMAESLCLTTKGQIELVTKSSTAFLAAAFGGVLAFLFRELYLASIASSKLQLVDFLLLPSYVLTAVIVSLFVSRITEARFPLTVKIMDFWGATAFGIIAAIGGNSVLETVFRKLINGG